jgi:hypothetical protein
MEGLTLISDLSLFFTMDDLTLILDLILCLFMEGLILISDLGLFSYGTIDISNLSFFLWSH